MVYQWKMKSLVITRLQKPSYHLHPRNIKRNPRKWSLEDGFPWFSYRSSITFLDISFLDTTWYDHLGPAWHSQQGHLRLLNGHPAPRAKAIRGIRVVDAHDGNPGAPNETSRGSSRFHGRYTKISYWLRIYHDIPRCGIIWVLLSVQMLIHIP